MAKRGENIYKRKDGRWEGRFIKGYDLSGKAQYVRYLRVHSLLIILCRSFLTKQLRLCIGTWAGLRKPFIQMKQLLSSRQCPCCTSDLKMNLKLLHIAKKSEEISNLHLRFVSGAYCVEKWEMFSMSRVQQYHQKNG